MGTWLRNLLAAPTFEDEEQTRAARVLHVTLIILLLAAAGVTAALLAMYGFPRTLTDAFTPISGLALVVVSALFFFLSRRGHTRLVAALLVALMWGIITAWGVFFSGFTGENTLLIYPFLIALSGLLVSGPAAMAATWLSVFSIVAAYLAERYGFVTPGPQQADATDLILTLPVLFMTGLLLRYAVRSNAQGFARARLREHELRESNSRLAEARAALEERSGRLQAFVNECVDCLTAAGSGDLAARVTVSGLDGGDPLTMLGQHLNDTVASLQRMASQLHAASGSLAASAADIVSAAGQQAKGAGEQSAAIGQSSATIDEVQALAGQTAQRAESVAAVAQHTMAVAQAGRQAVAEAIAGMDTVTGRVEGISATILALSEQTQAIGGIIATVGSIAKQSNLLALNAAVEAARAGEAGRGFAVVAGEVRALAEQSRAATVQVGELLSQIQNGVNSAVLATEEGLQGVRTGAQLTGEAGEAIARLAESVSESAQAAAQIAAAAGQQRVGMEQLAAAMTHIRQVTAQTLASAQQTEHTAAALNTLSGRLRELVEQYRL